MSFDLDEIVTIDDGERRDDRELIKYFTMRTKNIANGYTEADFVDENLPMITRRVRELLQNAETILNEKNNTDSVTCDDLEKYITNCLNITDVLVDFLNKVYGLSAMSVADYKSLPLSIVEIISMIFSHCKKGEKVYIKYPKEMSVLISFLFKRCNVLQSAFFSILLEKIVLDMENVNDKTLLNDLLNEVANIGAIVTTLDVKTTAEIWKSFIKLFERFLSHTKYHLNYCHIFKTICNIITENMSDASLTMSDFKTASRNVKVSDFVIKILTKIVKLTRTCPAKDVDPILECLIFLHRKSPYLISSYVTPNVVNLVRTAIWDDVELLLLELLSDACFQNCLVKSIRLHAKEKIPPSGYPYVIINIMKTLNQTVDDVKLVWVKDSDDHIISLLLEVISLSGEELMKSIKLDMADRKISLYNYIVVNTAHFIVASPDISVVEKILLKSILNSNIWIGMFTCDLWLTLAPLLPVQFIGEHFELLVEIYEKFECGNLLMNTPQKIFIQQVLLSFFKQFTDDVKNEMRDKYPLSEHLELWTVIGIDDEAKTMIDTSLEELRRCFQSASSERTGEKYQKIRKYLLILSTFKTLSNDETVNLIADIWTDLILRAGNEAYLSYDWFHDFVHLTAKITVAAKRRVNNEIWIRILEAGCRIYEELPSVVRITLLETAYVFVEPIFVNDEHLTRAIKAMLNKFMSDSNVVIKLFSAYAVLNMITMMQDTDLSDGSAVEQIAKTVNALNVKITPEHRDEYLKKLQFYRCEIDEIIEQIQSNTSALSTLIEAKSLSSKQKFDLERIKNAIENIIRDF